MAEMVFGPAEKSDLTLTSFSRICFVERHWLKIAQSCDQWLIRESTFAEYFQACEEPEVLRVRLAAKGLERATNHLVPCHSCVAPMGQITSGLDANGVPVQGGDAKCKKRCTPAIYMREK